MVYSSAFYNELISDSVFRLVHSVSPGNRQVGIIHYPPGAEWSQQKASASQSIIDWFESCVRNLPDDDLELCKLEENIGLFTSLAWKNCTEFTGVSMQAIAVPEGRSIEELLEGGEHIPCQYYRADYHPDSLGLLFREPIVHMHTVPKDAPRLTPTSSPSGNLLMDFVEFLYLSHAWKKWERWAENVWIDYIAANDPEKMHFELLSNLFTENEVQRLQEEYTDDLRALKKALIMVKDQAFPLRVPRGKLDTFCYP